MASFKFSGNDLFMGSNKIASIRGTGIYNKQSNKVATVKGNEIFNASSTKVATVNGTDIYNKAGNKFATMSDVKRDIDGAMGGASIVALWLFFVR